MDRSVESDQYISNIIISMIISPMPKNQQTFATLLHRAAALWRTQLDERLRPWNMTQATWRTLWALRMSEERYNQSSLAARLGIETPTLVHIIDRMETLGLLRREASDRDRRQKYITITEKGLALATEIEGEVVGMRDEMLEGLSDVEIQSGIRLFEQIVANAERLRSASRSGS